MHLFILYPCKNKENIKKILDKKDGGLFDIIFAEPDMLNAVLSLEEKEPDNMGEPK